MVSESNKQSIVLGGTHRSMAGWPQLIERVEAIPQPFQQPYRSLLAEVQPFPYLIFAPAIVGIRRKTNSTSLYAPVVARVRPQAAHDSQAQRQAELAKFNYDERTFWATKSKL